MTKKEMTTVKLLGYTTDKFMERISLNFLPGMTWENYGEWVVDHTIPVASFIKRGEVRPQIINALCNLRPMWASDNASKGAKHPFKDVV